MGQEVEQRQDHQAPAPPESRGADEPEHEAPPAPESRGAQEPEHRLDQGQFDDLIGATQDRYGARWTEIQASFVDEPRQAVEDADRLLSEVIDFMAEQRDQLARRLSGTEDDTESLRVGLQQYRRLFGSLAK